MSITDDLQALVITEQVTAANERLGYWLIVGTYKSSHQLSPSPAHNGFHLICTLFNI